MKADEGADAESASAAIDELLAQALTYETSETPSLTGFLSWLGEDDIEVGTIMPWAVDTPWWTHAANYTGHAPRMAMMAPR